MMIFNHLLKSIFLILIVSTSGCTQHFFYPQKTHIQSPKHHGFSYEDINITAADGTKLHGWLVKPKQAVKGVIYFLHGNAENISTHSQSIFWMVKQGYEVFALDYRGFGKSSGKPQLPDIFDDIDAGAKWVFKRSKFHNKQKPIVFAQSIGGSLAITYLSRHPEIKDRFAGLISEGAFSSYDGIARHVLSSHWLTWLLRYPVSWLIPNQYDPIDAASQLAPMPVLIIHSKDDQIIPFSEGQKLMERLSEPKVFLPANGPHIQASENMDTRQKILEFMESLHDK